MIIPSRLFCVFKEFDKLLHKENTYMLIFGNTVLDSAQHEVDDHGTADFPIACYFDDLTQIDTPWHWHDEIEIGTVESGSVIISTSHHEFTAHEGDCIFINSGILHSMRNAAPGEECHLDLLVFHTRLLSGYPGSRIDTQYIQPVITNPAMESLLFSDISSNISALIPDAWMECVKEDFGFEVQIHYLLSQLFLYLNQTHISVSASERTKMLRTNERIKKMLTYIHEHFPEEITVSQIAMSAAISESECLRCFRNVLKMPPVNYLRSYRIQKCAELLLSTSWKISYIAEECGFHEMSYFSKIFKEVYHCTPSDYRRQGFKH